MSQPEIEVGQVQTRKPPSIGWTIYCFVCLIWLSAAIGYSLTLTLSSALLDHTFTSGNYDNFVQNSYCVNFILRLVIGLLSAYGVSFAPNVAWWKRLLGFVLSWLPIGSWFAIFFASRALAKSDIGKVLVTIVALLALGFGYLIYLNPVLPSAVATKPVVLATSIHPTPRPTVNPLRTQGCIKWSDVQQEHIGRTICVFGIVKLKRSSDQLYTIQFSDDWNDFKIQDWNYNYYYPEVKPGVCIVATGRVVDNVSFLMLLPNTDEGAMRTYSDPNDCR